MTTARIPAHYLTPLTLSGSFPLVVLMGASYVDPEGVGSALPVAVGLSPRPASLDDGACPGCESSCWVWVEDPEGEPGEVACLYCLTLTSEGVAPPHAVEGVGVE